MQKKWLIGVLAGLCFPAAAQAITIERIAAIAGDDVITLQDLREEGKLLLLMHHEDINDIDTASDREARLEELTRALVQARLISRQAKKSDINVGDREVDLQVREQIRQNGASEEDFRAMLEENGIDYQIYREYTRREIEKIMVVRSELVGQVQPDEADVVTCAQNMAPGAEHGISVTLSQIVIPEIQADSGAGLRSNITSQINGAWWNALDAVNERYVEGVYEVVTANPDRFIEYVHKYSTGQSVARDGLLGTFGPGDLSSAFSVVFTLQKDEIAPIVTTPDKYHILRVDDVVEGGESEVWKKAMGICREQIFMTELQRLAESWFNDLLEKNYVSITVNNDIKQ